MIKFFVQLGVDPGRFVLFDLTISFNTEYEQDSEPEGDVLCSNSYNFGDLDRCRCT